MYKKYTYYREIEILKSSLREAIYSYSSSEKYNDFDWASKIFEKSKQMNLYLEPTKIKINVRNINRPNEIFVLILWTDIPRLNLWMPMIPHVTNKQIEHLNKQKRNTK